MALELTGLGKLGAVSVSIQEDHGNLLSILPHLLDKDQEQSSCRAHGLKKNKRTNPNKTHQS